MEPGETGGKPRRLTVVQAAVDGSHHELLQALRALWCGESGLTLLPDVWRRPARRQGN